MYRHILVPIDDTELSIDIVGKAAALARSVGARITFFHAVADHAGSLGGDSEILRVMSPNDYAYGYLGKARELLAKAESAARALGVQCASLHVASDKPATAIVEAAHLQNCDLIFMASHGQRSRLGMVLASNTLGVLMASGLPVLVSSTGGLKAPARAVGIIRDEHRSLGAVIHAWLHALEKARAASQCADPVLIRAMLRYVQAFPLALHHPKEDEYLFKLLRQRTDALNTVLDDLSAQHVRDHELVDELAQAVAEVAGAANVEAAVSATVSLETLVRAYANFLWDHLGREEGVILPAAQQYLTEADWSEIDAAFGANQAPRFRGETDLEFRQLFSRIVNAADAWQ